MSAPQTRGPKVAMLLDPWDCWIVACALRLAADHHVLDEGYENELRDLRARFLEHKDTTISRTAS